MNDRITKILAEELLNPTFEMTRQYLRILEVEYDKDVPKIAHIEFDEISEKVKAYVHVKHESFYLEFTFDATETNELYWIDTAPYIRVDYKLTSEELTVGQFLETTTAVPTEIIYKVDSHSEGHGYRYNGISFSSSDKPGRINEKISDLLDKLETDKSGIKKLASITESTDLFITVVYHIGTGMFTGLYLEKEIIDRLSQLGLSTTFDIYAMGQKFIED